MTRTTAPSIARSAVKLGVLIVGGFALAIVVLFGALILGMYAVQFICEIYTAATH